MNIFEKASKYKLRFNTPKGVISTDDLWDLSLEQLDQVAIATNKQLKATQEESFIQKTSAANVTIQLRLDIVVHIIKFKQAQEAQALVAAEKRAKKAQLLELINQKENEQLGSKSLDELRAELEAL